MVGVGWVALMKGILGISEGYARTLKKLRILDGFGLGSAFSKMEGRYSDAGTHVLHPHAMHRWLCGTFGRHMLPRLGRHASMTPYLYSLRIWTIVDAKGMTDRSVGKPMVCWIAMS
ncbi:unnamed protein product [Prunus armeniaca]